MARLEWIGCLLLVATTAMAVAAAESEAETLSTYIVHVAPAHAPRSSRPRVLSSAYTSFLRDRLPAAAHTARLLYSYAHAATGFAARLTDAQATQLASHEESVLAVVPDCQTQCTSFIPPYLRRSSASPRRHPPGFSRLPAAPMAS
ncbi:unnamed protein product [Urochloa humidicola]